MQAQPHNDTEAGAFSKKGIQDIQKYFEAYVSDQQLPGVTLALARHGKLATLHSVGFQDIETGVPATDSTIFRIASMTKIVTSVAVMQLVEQGKIALEYTSNTLYPGSAQ